MIGTPKPPINKYAQIASEMAKLVEEKQKQYGNSINNTGEFLKLLYPNGIQGHQMEDVGLLVRIFDKMKRVANGNLGNENAWNDILGYALLKADNIKK